MVLQKDHQFLSQKMKNKKFIQISLVLLLFLVSTASVLLLVSDNKLSKTEGLKILPSNPSAENPYYFIYDLKPGEELKDLVTIINDTDSKEHISLYALDQHEESTKDNFSLKTFSPNNPQEEIGKWISFDGNQSIEFDIEANSEEEVVFDIKIPNDADYKEYAGGIAFSYVYSTA